MKKKVVVRKMIEEAKEKYIESNDKSLLLEAALLKGYYLALGGKKGIAIPKKFDRIICMSKSLFKYKINIDIKDNAYMTLYKEFLNMGLKLDYFNTSFNVLTNEDTANLIAFILTECNEQDIVINYKSINDIALNILNLTN